MAPWGGLDDDDGMREPSTWITDLRHFLDEESEDFPESIPEPALNLAVYLGAIVAWVTDHAADPDPHTNVPCRRSPGRRRCRGEIFAELDATSKEIVWQCPLCGDRGVVYGWEGSFWDRRPAPSDVLE